MESQLDSSLYWSGSSGPLSAPPLDEECPDGQPPRDSGFAHDHRELVPVSSPRLDMKSSGGQSAANPMFADDNKVIIATPSSTASASDGWLPTPASSDSNDQYKSTDDNFLNKFDVNYFCTVNSHIHHERFDELLKLIDIDGERHKPVNLMNDPVLNVVISANKTQLAVKLIEKLKTVRPLWEKNIYGDTALHIAAVKGNIIVALALLERESELVEAIEAVEENITIAEVLLQRKSRLVKAVNKKGETAVHKAAMYGRLDMFWYLVNIGGLVSAMYRKGDGSNMLHCAIMGNDPKLALYIARNFRELILSRDEAGLTPLQLIVTIPSFLRSPLLRGRLQRFLYKLIPIKVRFQAKIAGAGGWSVDRYRDEESYGSTWKSVRSKFRPQYIAILNLTKLIGNWVRYGVLVILKQVYRPMNDLAKEKERYMAAMTLVEYLAAGTSFDFYGKGYRQEPNPTVFDAMRSHGDLQYTRRDDDTKEEMLKKILNEANPLPIRWMEPPLIIAAELGLEDFVRKILEVCPQSAIYLDSKGRNVVQVAIQSGHEKVVSVISEMLQGSNPILPSYLLSMLDNETERNTILHLAAENSPAEEGGLLQLHDDLVWFEMVEKIVPKELVYSRNRAQKTAHELFTVRHKTTLESCKKQLVDIGKMCSGLVAAAVFASSFSFPDEKKTDSVKLAFTIFSHAYVIGFGCAATAMVLFMSLVIVPYKEHYFRRAIPMQFLSACLSFALALVAFLVSFACNFVVQICGGKKTQMTHLVSIFSVPELLFFPVVCITVLRYFGAKFGPSIPRFLK